jgi:integrase
VDPAVAASTQNQALSALLFLYRAVLELEVPWLDGLVHARRPERLPVVLTRDEVRAVLQRLEGAPRLMAYLLYGAELRLLECCRLRVQDVDFGSNQLIVRAGKGDKDRVTMLPAVIKGDLARHVELARAQHRRDLERGAGWVELPTALARNDGRRPARRARETRRTAYLAALIRDAFAGGRPGHPDRPRTTRPPGREHHDDLHARPEPGPGGGTEPGGPDVRTMRRMTCGRERRAG